MTSAATIHVCAQGADPAPLQSVHSTISPGLLRRLGASLLVTTYQAGKLVMVWDEGDRLDGALVDVPPALRGPDSAAAWAAWRGGGRRETRESKSQAGSGGGLFNDGGTLALTDVIFAGNTADTGGGLYNNGTATLSSVQILGNRAAGGGGLFNSGPDGAMTLTDVAVIGNAASDVGGGLMNAGGTVTLTNATVAVNTASNKGGGLLDEGGTLSVTNANFSLR